MKTKKKDAEEKLKEINEAYAVLSDADKKRKYDQFGHAAFENGGFGGDGAGFSGFDDIFSNIFRGFSGGFNSYSSYHDTRSYEEPGADLRYSLEITLEEAAEGVEKTIKYTRNGKCTHCNGSGAEKDHGLTECKTCNGNGYIIKTQRTILGAMQTQTICPDCHGKGKVAVKKCKHCHGSGIERESVTHTVKIPAGISTGQKIKLAGMGQASDTGGPNGDLYVVINIKRHEIFERDRDDLYCEVPISYSTAVLGGEIEIPILKGKKTINIPSGFESGKMLRVKSEGITRLRSNFKGDLIVKLVIDTPKNLNEKQKELLKKFEDSLNEKNYHKKSGFFEKVKKMFEK